MKKYEDSTKESKEFIKNTNNSKKKVMKSSKKKMEKSSSHLNVLKRRLNKWVNESNRGNIVIETLAHPLENNKALVSLRQFQMNEETKRFDGGTQ